MPNKERQKRALKDWIRAEGGYQPKPLIGDHEQIAPPNAGSNVRVPKKGKSKVEKVTLSCLESQLIAEGLKRYEISEGLLKPYVDLPPTQQKIHEIMGAMKDLLLYKNQKYGDSAINPKRIFYKGDSTNSILIRLDDKLGRVMSNTEEKPRINDVCDIIGYCVLLLISLNVTAEDIAKFKD